MNQQQKNIWKKKKILMRVSRSFAYAAPHTFAIRSALSAATKRLQFKLFFFSLVSGPFFFFSFSEQASLATTYEHNA